ncbi:MAG TPA: histidine kinase [Bryobacteraceae bacterium]|nr:histidine kinase [Bryobacteraceae bacterium]
MLEILESRRVRWLIALAAWPALALLMAAQEYLYRSGIRMPISWFDALRWPVVEYPFWAISVPLIFDAGRRFSFDRERWVRSAAALAGFNLGIIAVHAVYRMAFHDFVYPQRLYPRMERMAGSELLRFYSTGNFLSDIWMFWTIISIVYLVEYYRRYRQRERELTRTQLQVLRAQLQPHFLFNTLNSISTLMHEDPEAADTMMANLAALLRRTLSEDHADEVTLRTELETLDLYLDIQRTRFQDRLCAVVSADPDVLCALVPALILQPLVENAVRHGIARRPGPGRIEVRASRRDDQLELSVSDDGAGLTPEAIPQDGIGLSNTRARLGQHYGHRQSFELRQGTSGAVATVRIPFMEAGTHP